MTFIFCTRRMFVCTYNVCILYMYVYEVKLLSLITSTLYPLSASQHFQLKVFKFQHTTYLLYFDYKANRSGMIQWGGVQEAPLHPLQDRGS